MEWVLRMADQERLRKDVEIPSWKQGFIHQLKSLGVALLDYQFS